MLCTVRYVGIFRADCLELCTIPCIVAQATIGSSSDEEDDVVSDAPIFLVRFDVV